MRTGPHPRKENQYETSIPTDKWFLLLPRQFTCTVSAIVPYKNYGFMRVWRNGRHVALRTLCRKTWGFESLHPHEQINLYGIF